MKPTYWGFNTFLILDDEKFLVEPSCAASLAIIYNGMLNKLNLPNAKKVAVVVCGGNGVNMALLKQWQAAVGC